MDAVSNVMRRSGYGLGFLTLPVLAMMIAGAAHAGSDSPATACSPLTLPEVVGSDFIDEELQIAAYSAELSSMGGKGADFFFMEFYGEAFGQTGTFALGQGDNGNYATCFQCLLLCLDYDKDEGCHQRFFADRGALLLINAPGEDDLEFHLTGWRFVEVTIDPTTYESTPVPGGTCYVDAASSIFADGFD